MTLTAFVRVTTGAGTAFVGATSSGVAETGSGADERHGRIRSPSAAKNRGQSQGREVTVRGDDGNGRLRFRHLGNGRAGHGRTRQRQLKNGTLGIVGSDAVAPQHARTRET